MSPLDNTLETLRASGDHGTARSVERGRELVDRLRATGSGVIPLGRGVARGFEVLTAPFGAVGKPVLGLAGRGLNALWSNPNASRVALALGLTVPGLAAATSGSFDKNVNTMMASGMPKFSSEDNTVLKRHFIKSASVYSLSKAMFSAIPEEIGKGFGGGIGKGLVDAGFSGAAALGRHVMDSRVASPRRERAFLEAVRTDSVLRDAVRTNQKILGQLKEAFSTLVRFAPTMAEDVNAVRSYLRESVLSGGGINYATIKQLAETEKLVQERNRAVRSR